MSNDLEKGLAKSGVLRDLLSRMSELEIRHDNALREGEAKAARLREKIVENRRMRDINEHALLLQQEIKKKVNTKSQKLNGPNFNIVSLNLDRIVLVGKGDYSSVKHRIKWFKMEIRLIDDEIARMEQQLSSISETPDQESFLRLEERIKWYRDNINALLDVDEVNDGEDAVGSGDFDGGDGDGEGVEIQGFEVEGELDG